MVSWFQPKPKPLAGTSVQILENLLGMELLGYLGGSNQRTLLRDVRQWRQDRIRRGARRRFELTSELLGLFHRDNWSHQLKPWLRDVDPQFGNRAPATVIRDTPGQRQQLLDAARAYIERDVERRRSGSW